MPLHRDRRFVFGASVPHITVPTVTAANGVYVRAVGRRNLMAYNETRHLKAQVKEWSENDRENLFSAVNNGIPDDAIADFIDEVKTSDDVPELLPSNFKKEDAAMILLWWLVDHNNATSEALQHTYGVPKVQWVRIIERLVPAMKAFIQTNIQLGTLEERKAQGKDHFPEPFKDYTGIIDGVHIRISGQEVKHSTNVFPDGNFGSHKFGFKNAVSFQAVVSAAGECILVDDGNPAGVHDYKCLWRANFDNQLKFPDDKLLADAGFIGNRIRLFLTTPKKKPANRELNATEMKTNKKLSAARVRVEHFFGVAKGRFDFLRKYRGPLHLLPVLTKFAFAMINYCLRNNYIDEAEKHSARAKFLTEECKQHDFDNPYLNDLEPAKYIGGKRYLLNSDVLEQNRWELTKKNTTLTTEQLTAMVNGYVNHYQAMRYEALNTEILNIQEVEQALTREYQRLAEHFSRELREDPISQVSRTEGLYYERSRVANHMHILLAQHKTINDEIRKNNEAVQARNNIANVPPHSEPVVRGSRGFSIESFGA